MKCKYYKYLIYTLLNTVCILNSTFHIFSYSPQCGALTWVSPKAETLLMSPRCHTDASIFRVSRSQLYVSKISVILDSGLYSL